MNIFSSKKFKMGAFATALTAVFVALIILLNVIVSVVSRRFPFSLDFTSNKDYEISKKSLDFISSLDDEVSITILASEAKFNSQAGNDFFTYFKKTSEFIKLYAQSSDKISLTFLDLSENPQIKSSFKTKHDVTLYDGAVLIECAATDRYVQILPEDLFNVQQDQNTGMLTIISSKAEQVISSAVLNVTTKHHPLITFLDGNDESQTTFPSILQQNGYDTENISFVSADINPESIAVFIVGPTIDFTTDQIERLEAFLYNDGNLGKNLFFFADFTAPQMPNLERFLKEWGIGIKMGIVGETNDANIYPSPRGVFDIFASYSDTNYISNTMDTSKRVKLYASRFLELFFQEERDYATKTLLYFDSSAIVQLEDEDSVRNGPFYAMVQSEKTPPYLGNDKKTSSLYVCASQHALADDALQGIFGNREFLINILNVITDRENIMTIFSKDIGSPPMNITKDQAATLEVLFVWILPLAVLAVGAYVFIRRRNK